MPADPPGADKPGAAPEKAPKACPICGKPTAEATRPFCSPRCRDIDLNRWLSGNYVVPGRDDEVDDVE